MRKFKFRFWDRKFNKISDIEELSIRHDGQIWWMISDGSLKSMRETIYYEPIYARANRFIPMQYTGLKDKNGKEIYEGYIVRDNNGYIGWVEWVAPKFKVAHKQVDYKSFSIVNDEEVFSWYIDYVSLEKNLWEIIGNIYENPELLDDIK